MAAKTKLKLIFLPAWAAGHLISMVETAKRILLHDRHNRFSVTVLLAQPPPSHSISSTTTDYIRSLASSGLDITFEHLPAVDPPTAAQDIEDFVSLYLQSHEPHVKAAISDRISSGPVGGLFLDFFGTTLIDVAKELGVRSYVYFTSTGTVLDLMLHMPELDEKIPVDFKDWTDDIEIPGISPIPPLSMPNPVYSKKYRSYFWFVSHGKRFRELDGIIVNTFDELEPGPLRALANRSGTVPPIYPVGPVLLVESSDKHECIEWLKSQPDESVVFLCFGSMGSFDAAQVGEMAAALERSGHRFLWCLRSRSEGGELADTNLDEVLPEGFLERTARRGMVWPKWAPQADILAHRAVGGFVTHCGWNSCLESLWFGVPMIGWPLYAEQHLNAFEMAKDLGVSLELKLDRGKGGFVESEELERAVRCLMGDSEEGKRVRKRAHEMKVAARKAVEEGGSAYVALESFIHKVIEEMPSSE